MFLAHRPISCCRRAEAEGIGEASVDAFVWSALPATVAALGLTPFVLQHGTYSWLQSAIAGVLAFTAAPSSFHLTIMAGCHCSRLSRDLLTVGMRAMLVAAASYLDNKAYRRCP